MFGLLSFHRRMMGFNLLRFLGTKTHAYPYFFRTFES